MACALEFSLVDLLLLRHRWFALSSLLFSSCPFFAWILKFAWFRRCSKWLGKVVIILAKRTKCWGKIPPADCFKNTTPKVMDAAWPVRTQHLGYSFSLHLSSSIKRECSNWIIGFAFRPTPADIWVFKIGIKGLEGMPGCNTSWDLHIVTHTAM